MHNFLVSYTQEEIKFHWWWPEKETSSSTVSASIFNREKVKKSSRLKQEHKAEKGADGTTTEDYGNLGYEVVKFYL